MRPSAFCSSTSAEMRRPVAPGPSHPAIRTRLAAGQRLPLPRSRARAARPPPPPPPPPLPCAD